jgi:predicted amidohydrolase YtcJ
MGETRGVLIRHGQILGNRGAGVLADVRIDGGRVAELGTGLHRQRGEAVIDARGGAVLPGLHDHHCHLRAMVAAASSVAVGPSDVNSATAFATRLKDAAHGAGRGWVRATGYHESVAGPLDRHRLDAIVGDHPLRVQHRSGGLWVVSSAGLRGLGVVDGPTGGDPDGLERDERGVATGRLWRLDRWLHQRLPSTEAGGAVSEREGLGALGRAAAAYGVTGLTDATPEEDDDALATLATAHLDGVLPQRLVLMRARPAQARNLRLPSTVGLGPVKVILDDDRLPGLDDLAARIGACRDAGDRVAIHCVTAPQLVLTLAAYQDAGARPGDRIEHAAVVAENLLDTLRCLRVSVVTQPNFVAERGDEYRRDLPPGELDELWRARSLVQAGVTVAAGTDAPFGRPDPWAAIRAAAERTSRRGYPVGAAERVEARRALGWFLADPNRLERRRRVQPDVPADLCILRLPLGDALAHPDASVVRGCVIGGRMVNGEAG